MRPAWHIGLSWQADNAAELLDIDNNADRRCTVVRCVAPEKPGRLAVISAVFERLGASGCCVFQQDHRVAGQSVWLGVLLLPLKHGIWRPISQA
jgi:hypothetical protein